MFGNERRGDGQAGWIYGSESRLKGVVKVRSVFGDT